MRTAKNVARVGGVVVGSFALSLTVCVAFARMAPLPLDVRYAVAHFLLIPLWIGALTCAFALFGPSST
jgi:hypothetical protein